MINIKPFNFPIYPFQLRFAVLDAFNSNPGWNGDFFHKFLGLVLKTLVCSHPSECTSQCPYYLDQPGKCPYAYLYLSQPEPGKHYLRGKTNPPHPYVINFPSQWKSHYAPGDRVEVELVVFGNAIRHLPVLIHTLEKMGDWGLGEYRYRLLLRDVVALPQHPQSVNLFNSLTGEFCYPVNVDSPLSMEPAPDSHHQTISLELLSPLTILTKPPDAPKETKSRLAERLDFYILLPKLLTRISELMDCHARRDIESEYDFKSLIQQSRDIKLLSQNLTPVSLQRYSGKHSSHMDLSGYLGSVVYQGDFAPFLPWLKLGEYTRLGAYTHFGYGKYKVAQLT